MVPEEYSRYPWFPMNCEKFAGPAAQGRVRSCCDWLFNSISLINGPPQGAWVTYLGYPPLSAPFHPLPDPLWESRNRRRRLSDTVFAFFLPPRRRPRDLFARLSRRPSSAHVSGGLRGPFWEPFWPQKMLFLDIYVGPLGPHFGTDFQSFFATRAL